MKIKLRTYCELIVNTIIFGLDTIPYTGHILHQKRTKQILWVEYENRDLKNRFKAKKRFNVSLYLLIN